MKDKSGKDKPAESPHEQDVDDVRGETQMYGLTAPDHSRPRMEEQESLRRSSMVSFGDKKIDLDKMRDSYIGELVAGRFTITQFIDRGGMGEVYLGENEAVGQRVAVKFLNRKFTSDESIVTRFGNEAKSYARVNHPNAVTLLDYGQHDDGALYIITEFVDGKSLSKTIKKTGPFSSQQVISIGQQCCDVLTTAHGLGVIHRDLKPDNIMLIPNSRERYTVKILDFGIAKLSDDEHGSMTETGAIFGTPEFMSPEQARGDGAEPRSDLYALGVILYYMLTGKLPFSGKNKFAILNKHLNDPAPRPSDIAPHIEVMPALEGLILKCLNKHPEERYPSADDLYEALEEIRDQLGSSGSMTTSAPQIRREAPLADLHEEPSEPVLADTDLGDSGELEPIDESLDLEREPPAVQLGAYASLPDVELDDDIDDLHEGDDDELWDEWEEVPGQGRFKLLIGALLLVGIIGAVGWYVMNQGKGDVMTRVGDTSIDAISGVSKDEKASASDIERILVTSQVLGLLASAEQAVADGDISNARRQVETSKMWLADAALPSEGVKRRGELESTLQSLSKLEKELKAMRAGNKCRALSAKVPALKPMSEGLWLKWQKIESECVGKTPKKKSPPKKPAVKPDKLPSPSEVVNDVEPKKPEVKPDKPAEPEVKPDEPVKPDGPATGLPPKVL